MQTVNHYFGHSGIFAMHLLGFLVQRAVFRDLFFLNIEYLNLKFSYLYTIFMNI